MYKVSAEYTENIAKEVRTSRIYGQLRLKSGIVCVIDNADIELSSLTITSKMNAKGEFKAGGVYSSELSMTLLNFGDSARDLDGARVILFYDLFRGEDSEEFDRVPLGVFFVDGSTIKRKFSSVSFKAVDVLMNLDFPAEERTGSLYELAAYACSVCGVGLSTTHTEFGQLPNSSLTASVNTARVQTWRDLLMYIGILTNTFIRGTRDGQIEFVPLVCQKNDGGVIIPVREIRGDIRYSTEFSDDTTRFVRIIMRRGGAVLSSTLKSTAGGSEDFAVMEWIENPLLEDISDEDVPAILNNALRPAAECLNRAFKAEFNGDAALEVGDYVRLRGGAVDTARGYATGMITSQTWRYRGGHSIRCSLPSAVSAPQQEIMTLAADVSEEPPVRIPPKSQEEKRLDELEARMGQGGGTAEKLQTGDSKYYAVTKVTSASGTPTEGLFIENGTTGLQIRDISNANMNGWVISNLPSQGASVTIYASYPTSKNDSPLFQIMANGTQLRLDGNSISAQVPTQFAESGVATDYTSLRVSTSEISAYMSNTEFVRMTSNALEAQNSKARLELNANGLKINNKYVVTED